jgi:hypothetical protein
MKQDDVDSRKAAQPRQCIQARWLLHFHLLFRRQKCRQLTQLPKTQEFLEPRISILIF